MGLAEVISRSVTERGEVRVYWLGGAGFVFRTREITVGVDIYLSDTCRTPDGRFKRLIPAPLTPEDLDLDLLVATHHHGDHLDMGSLDKLVVANPKTRVAGPTSCVALCLDAGVERGRVIELNRGSEARLRGAYVRGVFSDHGPSVPDAIGVVFDFGGKTVYITGDTCYRPDLLELVRLDRPVDLLIVPINGRFGNADPRGAAAITRLVKPRIVVPCHFWLSKDHGGDPLAFFEECSAMGLEARIEILAIGEELCI